MSAKNSATYDLASIQQAFSNVSGLRVTASALDGAAGLGLDEEDMVRAIQSITRVHFYKSMSSEKDPGKWQDVYRVPYQGASLYVKFTIGRNGGVLLISFKEL